MLWSCRPAKVTELAEHQGSEPWPTTVKVCMQSTLQSFQVGVWNQGGQSARVSSTKFWLWGHFEFTLQAFFISDVDIITSPSPSGCEYEKRLHSRKPLSAQGQDSEWLNCFIPGDFSYMPFQSSEVKTVSTSFSQMYPHHHWPFIPSWNAVYDVLHKVLV